VLILVTSLLIALTVSFLCSLMEACLLSLTPAQIAAVSQRHPRIGSIWRGFKANFEQPISVILILNTSAYTIGAAVAGSRFDDLYGNEWLLLFSVALTYVMVQFTEILPKTLGVRYNRGLSLVIAQPLRFLVKVFHPISRLVNLINRPFEGRRGTSQVVSLDEIGALAGLARLSDLIGLHQEKIITNASRLSQRPVSEVMIPADQVTFLSTSQTLPDAIVTAHLDPHTRFPICEGDNCNRIAGYINFKEMIYFARTNPNDHSITGIIRPVTFVPPDRPITELLRIFVEEHVHMAIVRSAEGKTLGLVTLEDIVEELVGELEDEFDRMPRMFHPLSGGTWMVGGGTTVEELAARLGVERPAFKGTVSAWLIQSMGSVPKPGEVHRWGRVEFTIRRTRRRKIFEVAVRMQPE
jgi:CBS domain containing-hemolysin-like protein